MAAHPKTAVPKTPLEAFAKAKPEEHISMLLWMNRHQNPDMAVSVTEDNIKAFNDCMGYLKVKPEVKIVQRKNYVGIVLVEAGTGDDNGPGNAIRPVENNEADLAKAFDAERIRRIKENAPSLASLIRNQAAAGDFSSDLILQAAEALQILSAK